MKCAPIITLPATTKAAIPKKRYLRGVFLQLSTSAAMNAVAACPEGNEAVRYSSPPLGLGAEKSCFKENIIAVLITVAAARILLVIFSPSNLSNTMYRGT